MIRFLLEHQFSAAVVIYWIFSAAVSGLPEPSPYRARASRPKRTVTGKCGYLWLYRFLHTTAGNLTTVFGSRIPGLKIIATVVLVPLLLSTTACAAHYTIHPGALNVADSAAYDTLLIAETLIDEARAKHEYPPAFPQLVASYNIARESWLAYRSALSADVPPDAYFLQLNKDLTDLVSAIRAFPKQGAR